MVNVVSGLTSSKSFFLIGKATRSQILMKSTKEDMFVNDKRFTYWTK